MNDTQSHRGPDDSGIWEHRGPDGTWIGLGSRRLAILDLSQAGHMPMVAADGRLCITYNGEIYNSPELRQELISKGHRFKSHSDTEVLLKLYLEEGIECLRRLNGIFAFGLADLRGDHPKIILARDPLGVKPLYYWLKGDKLAFASESKALLELPGLERRIDTEALHQYMTFLWVPSPLTMMHAIKRVPGGHYLCWEPSQTKLMRYWDLEFPPKGHEYRITENEAAQEVERRFFTAVRRQMLSDVPVGTFLSSGIDSTSIVAAMAAASPQPVRTYTIAYPEKYRRGDYSADDPAVAARTASHFGAIHTEIVIEPNVVDLLPKLVWHMDDPTADPAIISAYLVNREARKTVTVLLSGVGGDEVFAGYRKYQAGLAAEAYRRLPEWLRLKLIDPTLRALPPMRGGRLQGLARLARKWGRSASLPPQEQFIMDSTYLDEEEKRGLYSPALQEATIGMSPASVHMKCFDGAAKADWLNQMLYLDSKIFMPDLNFNYNDKMSMASSVEVRVPFLDLELVEWSARELPPSFKMRFGHPKYIFKKAMQKHLPVEVMQRKKANFGAPINHWLANDLRSMTGDLLSAAQVKNRGYFDPKEVQRMIEEHQNGQRDWSYQIWQLLTLELWQQAFLDSARPKAVTSLKPVLL